MYSSFIRPCKRLFSKNRLFLSMQRSLFKENILIRLYLQYEVDTDDFVKKTGNKLPSGYIIFVASSSPTTVVKSWGLQLSYVGTKYSANHTDVFVLNYTARSGVASTFSFHFNHDFTSATKHLRQAWIVNRATVSTADLSVKKADLAVDPRWTSGAICDHLPEPFAWNCRARVFTEGHNISLNPAQLIKYTSFVLRAVNWQWKPSKYSRNVDKLLANLTALQSIKEPSSWGM
jgi:hypothetical protein